MGDIAHHPGQTDRVSATQSCDVLMIGGGPAGSTAGNLLAQAGRRVVDRCLAEPGRAQHCWHGTHATCSARRGSTCACGRRSSFTVVRLQRHLPLRPPLERSAVLTAG